jgi:hypothetical protein
MGAEWSSVATNTAAGEVQDDKQEDQAGEDGAKHFRPAWCAGGRFAAGPLAGLIDSLERKDA